MQLIFKATEADQIVSNGAELLNVSRAPSELSAHQKKILPIDDHVGISIAGLTADARLLCKYMRTECMNSRYAYATPLPVGRLVAMVGNKSQIATQRYGRRPFGVGLLIAGYDEKGAHIYQTCPSANYFDCKAMAIGARSQSARTYLERNLDKFKDCGLNDLVLHGLRALRDTLPNEVSLTTKNCSVGIVGADISFTVYDDDEVQHYLQAIEGEAKSAGAGADDEPEPPPSAAMDVDDGAGGAAPMAVDDPQAGAPAAPPGTGSP